MLEITGEGKIVRKLFAFVLMMVVMTSFVTVSYALEFSDLNAGSDVYKLVDGGIINGFDDGTFRPEGSLTRAQAAKIINLIFGYTEESEVGFTDVTGNEWYSTHALIAREAGYIEGYPDGTFKQGKEITRQEVCKIVVRILGDSELLDFLQFDGEINDAVDAWAEDDVLLVLALDLLKLDESGNFYARDPMTRLDFTMMMLYFYEDADPVDPVDPVTPPVTPGEPVEEDEVVTSIRNVSAALETVVFKDSHPEAFMQIVNEIGATFTSVLADASSGATITPAYVKTTYSSDISSVRSLWNGLTEFQQSLFRGLLIGYLDTADIDTLYSYFIG